MTDLAKQFLQVARTLDPDNAQKPDDTDSNDLKTINVYTVGTSCSTRRLLSSVMMAEVAQVSARSPERDPGYTITLYVWGADGSTTRRVLVLMCRTT